MVARIRADGVRDTSTTVGTGPLALSGVAQRLYRLFSAVMAVNDTTTVIVMHQVLDEWEVSRATYSATNELTRTTILASSNAGAAVNFSAGLKDILLVDAAEDETARGVGDAAATILPTDFFVYTNAAFTAPRAWTLPAANSVRAGRRLCIIDAQGTLTPTNKITITRAGSDTINGGTTLDLGVAYSAAMCFSDGISKWTVYKARTPSAFIDTFLDDPDAPTARATLYAAPFDAIADRNMILNGGMEVSQEFGTALQTTVQKYIVDQWGVFSGGAVVLNAQQVTDAPPGYSNSLKVTVTTADASIAAGDYAKIWTPIEGYRVARLGYGAAGAQSSVYGFWIKAHRAGDYSGSITNSAANRSYPFSFNVAAVDTWEFKTVTIPGDTTGTWLKTNGVGLYLNFALMAGSTYTGTAGAWGAGEILGVTGTINGVAATNDVFQITGVVALPGVDVPTAANAQLLLRPFEEELNKCLRYWRSTYAYGTTPGTADGTGTYRFISGAIGNAEHWSSVISPPMRDAPSATSYNPNTGASNSFRNDSDTSNVTGGIAPSGTKIIQGMNVGLTPSKLFSIHWVLSARL